MPRPSQEPQPCRRAMRPRRCMQAAPCCAPAQDRFCSKPRSFRPQDLFSMMNSVTMQARSSPSSSEVSPVESSSGSMGKFFTPRVYGHRFTLRRVGRLPSPLAHTHLRPPCRSARASPSGSLSAYSIWSRSREVSLSIEDQSSAADLPWKKKVWADEPEVPQLPASLPPDSPARIHAQSSIGALRRQDRMARWNS